MIMNLSVIIVSWNVREKLKDNIKALLASEGGLKFEIFVVDNASSDESAEMVAREFTEVKLIANKENLGFAKANNQAIAEASGEFILLLNPDMRVRPDTLEKMIGWMRDNDQSDVAGCRLVDEAGNNIPHVRRFPKIFDQAMIVLKLSHLFPRLLDGYLAKDFDYSQAAKVDSIRGSFFLIRRRALEKIGVLDERYFIWFEEVDYCRRIAETGGQVWYAPAAECIDFVGQSFAQVSRGRTQRYFRDSMIKYFKKWQPAWQVLILEICWPLGLSLTRLAGLFVNSKNK